MNKKRLLTLMGGSNQINIECPEITPTLGDELVTNGNMETGDPPDNWVASRSSLSQVADERTGGGGSNSLLVTNTDTFGRATQALTHDANVYLTLNGWSKRGTSSEATLRIVSTTNLNIQGLSTSWINSVGVYRVPAANSSVWCVNNIGADTTGYYDDVSVKQNTFTSMVSLLGTKNKKSGSYTCTPTVATKSQTGILIHYLDASNFIMAVVNRDTNKAELTSCVGGTWTEKIAGSITYGAAKELKVVVNSTTYQLFYDGVQIGSDTIIDNSALGLGVYGFNSLAGNTVGQVTTNPT